MVRVFSLLSQYFDYQNSHRRPLATAERSNLRPMGVVATEVRGRTAAARLKAASHRYHVALLAKGADLDLGQQVAQSESTLVRTFKRRHQSKSSSAIAAAKEKRAC